MKPHIRKLIAQIIEGLAVPMSLHHKTGILGTAYEPLAKLRDELHLFGYQKAEEIEKALAEYAEADDEHK